MCRRHHPHNGKVVKQEQKELFLGWHCEVLLQTQMQQLLEGRLRRPPLHRMPQ
jgi:hypothetical protein